MTSSEIDALWKDPANWRYRYFYFCKQDPRIFVPKRALEMGWTMNFSKKASFPVLFLIFFILLAPPIIAIPFGSIAMMIAVVITLLEAAIIVGICVYLASSERASKKQG